MKKYLKKWFYCPVYGKQELESIHISEDGSSKYVEFDHNILISF